MLHFFENEFPMHGNAPSTSGHESAISPYTFVQTEQTTIEDPEVDDNRVTQKSKRQRLQNPLVMISLYTSCTTLPKPLTRHIALPTLTLGRKRYGVRWIQL